MNFNQILLLVVICHTYIVSCVENPVKDGDLVIIRCIFNTEGYKQEDLSIFWIYPQIAHDTDRIKEERENGTMSVMFYLEIVNATKAKDEGKYICLLNHVDQKSFLAEKSYNLIFDEPAEPNETQIAAASPIPWDTNEMPARKVNQLNSQANHIPAEPEPSQLDKKNRTAIAAFGEQPKEIDQSEPEPSELNKKDRTAAAAFDDQNSKGINQSDTDNSKTESHLTLIIIGVAALCIFVLTVCALVHVYYYIVKRREKRKIASIHI